MPPIYSTSVYRRLLLKSFTVLEVLAAELPTSEHGEVIQRVSTVFLDGHGHAEHRCPAAHNASDGIVVGSRRMVSSG